MWESIAENYLGVFGVFINMQMWKPLSNTGSNIKKEQKKSSDIFVVDRLLWKWYIICEAHEARLKQTPLFYRHDILPLNRKNWTYTVSLAGRPLRVCMNWMGGWFGWPSHDTRITCNAISLVLAFLFVSICVICAVRFDCVAVEMKVSMNWTIYNRNASIGLSVLYHIINPLNPYAST